MAAAPSATVIGAPMSIRTPKEAKRMPAALTSGRLARTPAPSLPAAQQELDDVDLHHPHGHERKGDGKDEVDVRELPVEGWRGVGKFAQFLNDLKALHHHDGVEDQPRGVARQHAHVPHPAGKEAELDGHAVVGAQPGGVGRPEKDEPHKGIARHLLRPVKGKPHRTQYNLKEQHDHEKDEQYLADVAFEIVQNGQERFFRHGLPRCEPSAPV